MTPLDVLLIVTTISGWLAWGATYQHLRTVRKAAEEERTAARRLRKANLELLSRIADLDRQLKEHIRDSYEMSMMHPRQDGS